MKRGQKNVKKSWLKTPQIITTRRYILGKQLTTKDKKKILKAAREKKTTLELSLVSVGVGYRLLHTYTRYQNPDARSRPLHKMVRTMHSRPSGPTDSQPQFCTGWLHGYETHTYGRSTVYRQNKTSDFHWHLIRNDENGKQWNTTINVRNDRNY